MATQPPQDNSNPLERIARQLDYSRAKHRDLVAVTTGDLAYLMSQLQTQPQPAYKGETPQA